MLRSARFSLPSIILLAALFVMGLLSPVSAEEASRPNIILIVTDNQSPGLLGAYGNDEIKTPNIDRLARKGIKFTSAHATSGVCSPSRATLLTGLMPSQTGVHNALPSQPKVENWSAINEFRNLPMTLKTAGYRTGLVGKYHLGRHDNAQLGFDKWVTFPSGHTQKFYDVEIIEDGERYITPEHLTDFWTAKAKAFIEDSAPRDEPFFLLLTYNGPYGLPPVVNADYENRHTKYYIDNPPSMPQMPVGQNLENWAKEGDPKTYSEMHGITPWAAIRALNNARVMANLAAETTMIDDGVGVIMDALEQTGAADNTLVIYTSDQGAAYGQKGLWGNSSWAWPFAAYEANTRVPLILWDNNKRLKQKRSVSSIVNQYDFFTTILDYVGLTDVEIANSPGVSFASLLFSKKTDIKKESAAYFDYITARAVRTDRYRYVKRLLSGEIELYDLSNDPDEINNVATEPSYAASISTLDAMLVDFFEQYTDPDYDLWAGGGAKGRLLDGGRIDQYREKFPDGGKVELTISEPFDYGCDENKAACYD